MKEIPILTNSKKEFFAPKSKQNKVLYEEEQHKLWIEKYRRFKHNPLRSSIFRFCYHWAPRTLIHLIIC